MSAISRSYKPSSAVRNVLARYWYYLGIVTMFLIGWTHPSVGLWMKSVGVTPYLVAIAFFLNGFALSTESLLGSLKQWRILCVALLITFAVSPAMIWGIRQLIPGGDSLIGQGFQIVSLVPTLFVSAVVLTRIAKGNAAIALYLTVVSNLLAIIVAPILIMLTFGRHGAKLNLTSTSISMIFTVLIPTIAGQVARKRWENWAVCHAKLVTITSQCTILIFIINGVASIPRSVLNPSVVLIAIAGGIILHIVLMGIGNMASSLLGLDERTRRAMIFCSAQKSFVFNVLLCEHLFAGNNNAFGLAILPGIIYYLLVLAIDSVIAQRWEQQGIIEAKPALPYVQEEAYSETY